MKTSEILYLTADSLERDGWQGGGEYVANGRCVSNVMGKVAGRAYSAGHEALLTYLAGQLAGLSILFNWNDAPERTAAEVIATLRAAALIEAAKENTEARGLVSAS